MLSQEAMRGLSVADVSTTHSTSTLIITDKAESENLLTHLSALFVLTTRQPDHCRQLLAPALATQQGRTRLPRPHMS